MKINPLGNQPLVKTQGTSDPKTGNAPSFSEVLGNTLQNSPGQAVAGTGNVVGSMLHGINPVMDMKQDLFSRIDQVLNGLENYQILLGDGRVSLKDMAGAIDQLKKDARGMAAIMENLGDDEPMKPLINEALVMVSKEVSRFESGDYID